MSVGNKGIRLMWTPAHHFDALMMELRLLILLLLMTVGICLSGIAIYNGSYYCSHLIPSWKWVVLVTTAWLSKGDPLYCCHLQSSHHISAFCSIPLHIWVHRQVNSRIWIYFCWMKGVYRTLLNNTYSSYRASRCSHYIICTSIWLHLTSLWWDN